ncbi:PAS domain-containing protein [Desulfobacca acetoxidans]|uniref:histidine kinase n=1 Tax=Desulfobacca acetoxidans (strain ATCC 700848 / DSM 11109 / ASRB2) TaxID=880072 RepID=F2NC65_DESAR|nr:PAS domain-containing protein [Desulfobacca acetoxidans]AEB08860.1 PAS/PAC sensor signal transduction histidine kinase [Desulfobacca acetoxidans DSM 11109]
MNPGKQSYNIALVGAGRQGMAILEALAPSRRVDQPLRVVGVADQNLEAPGILYARRQNLPVFPCALDLTQLPELDILVDATGMVSVYEELMAHCPAGVMVLQCNRPHDWENFWDLITKDLSFSERYHPLKIAIMGGGGLCQQVLQQITGGLSSLRRISILGVADPDPEAPGIQEAAVLGIPTVRDYPTLLAQEPDLVLELTGDPEVRKSIIQKKSAQTQVIDHIQSRLFWELFQKEEDRLRLRVESEIKLANQRNQFQKIFDYLPDSVLVLNQDYLVEEVNQTFLTNFQKNAEEVVGEHCYKVLHQLSEPCDRHGMVCPLPQVLQECKPAQVLQYYTDSDGVEHYYEITISPLCPPEIAGRRVIEVIKDITTRQQLEEALKKSEEQTRQLFKQAAKEKAFLETIVNSIEDHMMVIEPDYRVVEVNRALLKMVGLRRRDTVGKYCYEISHHLDKPCSGPDLPCPLRDAVVLGKACSGTHVHFDKDGREHYMHVVCHPLFDEAGKVTLVINVARDVTKEIASRARMLHDDKMTSLGKLSASVVHEINNPMTGIMNLVKLMQRIMGKGLLSETESAKMHEYLDLIYGETSRVSKTVSNLLAFSRKTSPEFKPVGLNALLTETLTLTEYQLRLQGITVNCQFDPDLMPVLADPEQMKQVFLNLILNARDAMPDGGVLTLKTKNYRRPGVMVQIADTGIGIPKEKYSSIFEPFYTTKKAGSGAGLGLSVVYGIIQEHKGTIKVDSIVGQGTTFTIRLPAYKQGT